jgi:sec-independent protein translocase protein TatB
MFDLGWTELLLIGIVALIVVGPKDLPTMFRTLGRFTAKARNMAREFQKALDDAADQSGMSDTVKDLRDISNPRKMGLDKLNEAADKFEKWDPTKRDGPGPATAKMTEERAAAAEKVRRAMGETGKAPHEEAAAQPSEASEGTPTRPASEAAAAPEGKNDA